METTFAGRVLEYRKRKGLSQQAFADQCGLEQGNISQMEKGTEPKQSNVTKLLAGFPDLSPDWLLMGTGQMLRGGVELTPLNIPAQMADIAARTAPGLTSGAATVEYAQELASASALRQVIESQRQQIATLTGLLEWVKGLVPAALAKFLSSPGAACQSQPFGAVAYGG
jgi:transcriptional regulator with XRE-family HTH domain